MLKKCWSTTKNKVRRKKTRKIEALPMIMVLILIVYSVAEWKLRKRLKESGGTISYQIKKQTQKSTLK
jgi:transposase